MLGKKTVILTKIKKLVEDNLEINNISKKSRERDYVFARFLYFKIAKDCVETSLSNIASVVNRDHATAIHGIKQYDDLVKYNPGLIVYIRYHMKINKIQFDKIMMKWQILKYGTIDIHIQNTIDKVVDQELERDVFGNISFSEKDLIHDRLINIQRKVPKLLQNEKYEELAKLKKTYDQLLKKYKKL